MPRSSLGSYWVLVATRSSVVTNIAATMVLVVALTAAATCVFHDANHASFSTSRLVNRLAGYTGDLLGASSWIWRFKHNNLHHGNTNMVGIDADIDQAPICATGARPTLAPVAPLPAPVHVGAVRILDAAVVPDLRLRRPEEPRHRSPTIRPPTATTRYRHDRGRQGRCTSGGRSPCRWSYHRWWVVLTFYLAISWTVGLLLATMFQLAHCTELAEFPAARHANGGDRTSSPTNCEPPSTCTAAPSSEVRALHWLMGGLDFQVEHHLAPRLPHTVYPLVAERLQRACSECS